MTTGARKPNSPQRPSVPGPALSVPLMLVVVVMVTGAGAVTPAEKVATTADQLALPLRVRVPVCGPIAVTCFDSLAACEFPDPVLLSRVVNVLPAVNVPP